MCSKGGKGGGHHSRRAGPAVWLCANKKERGGEKRGERGEKGEEGGGGKDWNNAYLFITLKGRAKPWGKGGGGKA